MTAADQWRAFARDLRARGQWRDAGAALTVAIRLEKLALKFRPERPKRKAWQLRSFLLRVVRRLS